MAARALREHHLLRGHLPPTRLLLSSPPLLSTPSSSSSSPSGCQVRPGADLRALLLCLSMGGRLALHALALLSPSLGQYPQRGPVEPDRLRLRRRASSRRAPATNALAPRGALLQANQGPLFPPTPIIAHLHPSTAMRCSRSARPLACTSRLACRATPPRASSPISSALTVRPLP